jgi:hypothetical protein
MMGMKMDGDNCNDIIAMEHGNGKRDTISLAGIVYDVLTNVIDMPLTN